MELDKEMEFLEKLESLEIERLRSGLMSIEEVQNKISQQWDYNVISLWNL